MAAPRKTPQDHKEPAAEIREDAKAALESAPTLSETCLLYTSDAADE